MHCSVLKHMNNLRGQTKFNILDFFIQTKKDEKTIVGYGAPAKGNTLLN